MSCSKLIEYETDVRKSSHPTASSVNVYSSKSPDKNNNTNKEQQRQLHPDYASTGSFQCQSTEVNVGCNDENVTEKRRGDTISLNSEPENCDKIATRFEDEADSSNTPLTCSLSCSSAIEAENESEADSNLVSLDRKQVVISEKLQRKAIIINCTSGYVKIPIRWGEVPITVAKHYVRTPIQAAMRYPNCKFTANK